MDGGFHGGYGKICKGNKSDRSDHVSSLGGGVFSRLYGLSQEACFYQRLLERRNVPALPFVRLWVRASLLIEVTLS